jgi:serine/threonine-protein kinase
MTDDALYARLTDAIGHQYELEREIGRGGMAVVFRARDRRLNRPVAIKVLPPELAYDQAVRVRFTREAQTAAQLSHAHIVPIYDVGERDGIAYLVMALVTGGNLGALLAREPRQPVHEVRRFLCEIADALAYAHARGVIHRDIKPDNILLDRDSGRTSVTDFGIARAMEAGTRLTLTGVAVGTPTYMSPEQAMGDREIDGRSDLYSLGVVAYQMLTGRLPFTAGNSMAMLLKHVNERPPAIADLRPDTPRALQEAIERALMKSPEDRWPSASAMRDAIASDAVPAAPWRGDQREPVRYASPRPDGSRAERGVAPRNEGRNDGRNEARIDLRPDPRAAAPVARGASPTPDTRRGLAVPVPGQPGAPLVMEPAHLATLTPAQRADLRLWHGRIGLMDRMKAMRGYGWATVAAIAGGIAGFIVGVNELPPLVLAPIIPGFMSVKAWRRAKSLRASGLRIRRVMLMPRAKWVIPGPTPDASEAQLLKVAPRAVLDGPFGGAIRRGVSDRAVILELVAGLPKPDRAMLPDVAPTANALVERIVHLAQAHQRLDQGIDPRLIEELDRRIEDAARDASTSEAQRGLALLRRQRATLEELVQRRGELARQVESAGLALGSLRLDLVKFRSSGLQSALSDVSQATQEARALSRDIGSALDAAAEVRGL